MDTVSPSLTPVPYTRCQWHDEALAGAQEKRYTTRSLAWWEWRRTRLAVEIQPEFQLLKKSSFGLTSYIHLLFRTAVLGSVPKIWPSQKGGIGYGIVILWYEGNAMNGAMIIRFSGSEMGSYLSTQSSPYQCIYRSMRFKKLEPSNLGSAPKNHGNLRVIFSIHVEIPPSLPKTQVAAISCGMAVVSGLSSYGKWHLEICWVRDVMISKTWPGIQIISL